MKYKEIMVKFRKILADRFPGNYRYVPILAEILGIHQKTVYRKLRGESEFMFHEMFTIAEALDISLEPVFAGGGNTVKQPMELYVQDFSEPALAQKVIRDTLVGLYFAADSVMSTHMVTTNTIPQELSLRYKWIAKFMYLNWYYYNNKSTGMVPYSKIDMPDEFKYLYDEYWEAVGRMKRSVYIFTLDMMKHIMDNVLFFYNRGYVDEQEVLLLIKDYRCMLEDQEELCVRVYR